jgi:UDP-GlcNAc:undecaprenyl-phosphate GlcNAc-1-phosphate transferase
MELNWAHIFLEFTLSAAITLTVLWLLQPVAGKWGLLDHPDAHHPDARKRHAQPTATTGGLAMALGIFLPLMWFTSAAPAILAYMAAASLLVMVGLLDDRHDLPWTVRVLAQCAAVMVMIYGGGVRIEHIGSIFGVEPTSLGALSVPFTIFATVGVINALNMVDGVDGLAGSITLAAMGMLAIAALYCGNDGQAEQLVIFSGAVLGFLLLNLRLPWRPRARVFMGNAGSAFLGFTFVWATFRLTQNHGHSVTPILAPWLLATPLIDCVVLIARRLHHGQLPFRADRRHMHHLMLDAGFTPGQLTAMLTVINLTLGLAAAIALKMKVPQTSLVLAFVAICLWYFWLTGRRKRAVAVFARLHRFLTRSHLKPETALLSSTQASED